MLRSEARLGKRSERGVALALVLAVLICLLAVAIPFSLSMRHEHGGAEFRSFDDEARRTAASVRDLALAHLGDTAPDRDATPWADGPAETSVDVDAQAKELGIEEVGAHGRLLSAELEDQSGRIDLNRASLYLIARTLGLSTTLAQKLKADDREIRLVDGSFLEDEGFLWIDGEVTYYHHKDGGTVSDFTRPALVPGVWEPARLEPTDPREFESGEEVLDFRAWMVAAWPFKAASGQESRFETLAHPMAIAQFGRGALAAEQRSRLERLGTIWSSDAGRDRFGLATRVFSPIVAGETRELQVEQGAFVGRGSLCRITTYDGRVDHAFVRRCDDGDRGFKLLLEMPLTVAADAYQSIAEFLLPRPVNVNACSREVLELLLSQLAMRGRAPLDEPTTRLVADRILAARPLSGLKPLIDLLEEMVAKEKVLKGEQRNAILTNAEHSGSFLLEIGTAPLCFASDGVFDLRAAASLNWALNGREKARSFLREVVATSGAGRSLRLFATQRDFDEPWRITRLARDWTTFPENLQVGTLREGAGDPPSRLAAMLPTRSRFPSEELDGAAARVARGEMLIRLPQDDRTWHFDGGRGDRDSLDPDGWRLSDGALRFKADGQDPGVEVVQQNAGFTRPRPFGISLWWNPGRDLGAEQSLLDWKCNARAMNPELHDRVRLRFTNRKLEFEVDDAFLRQSQDDRYTSRIVYDFTDGLPLEADTWYHVTAFCRGNRAGTTSLWVDGKPRGKWSHQTRLQSQFSSSGAGANRIVIDPARLAGGTAKLPTRGAVRVGNEVFEYSSVTGGALTTTRDDADHFGGVRPSPNPQLATGGGNPAPPSNQGSTGGTNHPAQSSAELYGYSARLASDVPAGSAALDSDGLGRFGIAMVDPVMATTNITVQGNRGPINLGQGFESNAQEISLRQLDGNQLGANDKTFSKNGGYALLFSYELRFVNANDAALSNRADLTDLRTGEGSICGGVEPIGYAKFDSGKLTGVRRGQGLVRELAKTDFGEQNQKIVFPYTLPALYLDKHAFVQIVDPRIFSGYKPGMFVVLVIPIGVRAAGAKVTDHFLVPEINDAATDRAELLQIDSNFNDSGKDSTEWVRYNSIVQDSASGWNFLRSDPEAINWMRFWVEGGQIVNDQDSETFNGTGNLDKLYEIADALKQNNASNWAPGQSEYKKLVAAINQEDVNDPLHVNANRDLGNKLAFRGVLGTGDSEHSGSTKLYPVFRTFLSHGLPGRYDEVTLVGSKGERPERHIVNYGWPKPGCEDWDNYAHAAFLAEDVGVRFAATKALAFDTSNPTGYLANATYHAESRNFARMLKFPSGELPSLWDGSSELLVADGNGDGAKVDEVRLFAGEDPQPLFSHGLMALRRAVTVQEQDRFELISDAMRFPGQYIGGLAGLEGIHLDASVWQLGDDVIVCGERQPGSPIVQGIAEQGRTRFGGEPGYHEAGETAMVLPWHCMSRLSKGISATDPLVGLVDGAQFPRSGFLLVDQEVVAYTDLLPGGGGAQLYVPTFLQSPDGQAGSARGNAAFRARFGTVANSHAQDAVVFFWPWSFPDGYAARCEIPEMATYELAIPARRALFHSLMWREQQSDPLASLVASVRVQGRGGFAADPDGDPDFFLFEKPGTQEEPNLIDRQGDLLRVRFNVRYRAGAFDPVDFARNSWKRAPRIEVVGIEYLADRVVELHEESR